MFSQSLLSEIERGEGEALITAARRIPSARSGRPATLSRLLRWIIDGIKLPGGAVVKLEAARMAGRWVTTPGAIRRFVEAQNPEADQKPSPSATRRQQRAAKAGKALEKLGC